MCLVLAGPGISRCCFQFNNLMQGGDSVSLEKLGVSSDYHKKKAAANRHHREQAEREKIHKLYSSQPETHLRVVPIKGDGRCLFRAMVRSNQPACPFTLHLCNLPWILFYTRIFPLSLMVM